MTIFDEFVSHILMRFVQTCIVYVKLLIMVRKIFNSYNVVAIAICILHNTVLSQLHNTVIDASVQI